MELVDEVGEMLQDLEKFDIDDGFKKYKSFDRSILWEPLGLYDVSDVTPNEVRDFLNALFE